MAEKKTLLTFYESNAGYTYKMELKGHGSKDLLMLIGVLALCKQELLKDINEITTETDF